MLTTNIILTDTGPLVGLEGVPGVTPAYWAVLCVLTGVLTASVAMVTCHCEFNITSLHYLQVGTAGAWVCVRVLATCFAHTNTVSLVPGQLEPRATLAGHTPSGCLFADVGTAMLLIHTVEALWGRKRVRGTHWNTPTATGRQHTKAHMLRVSPGILKDNDCSHTWCNPDITPRVTFSTYTKPSWGVGSRNRKLVTLVALTTRSIRPSCKIRWADVYIAHLYRRVERSTGFTRVVRTQWSGKHLDLSWLQSRRQNKSTSG